MIKNSFKVQSGIGDGDDLCVKLHRTNTNKVFPQIHSGFYYLNNQEDYLYVSEGCSNLAVPSGVTVGFSIPTNPKLKEATISGPIIIDGTNLRYTRVSSNMSVFHSMSPTVSGSTLLFFNIPGEFLFATDILGNDMQTVSSTGSLTNREYCYFDFLNRIVWIQRDPSDINRGENLYFTYLKDIPTLVQEEIMLVDYDGNIRVMFDRVVETPVLVVPGIGNIAVSGVCKNVITPATTLAENTRVGIQYYIDGSFLITEDNNNQPEGTILSIYRSIYEIVNFRWEQSYQCNYLDTGVFPSSSESFVQINPLYSGIQSGFIYMDTPRLPEETLSYITVRASPLRLSGIQREPVRIAITTYDISNNIIPKVKVHCWIVNNNTGEVVYPIPMDIETPVNNKTDFNGKRFYMWESTPQSQGVYTVYASAMSVSGAIIDTHPLTVSQELIYTNLINTAKVSLYLNPSLNPNGLQDLYVYMTTQAGIPYIPDLNVAITCNLGLLFNSTSFSSSGNTTGVQYLVLSFDTNNLSGLRVASCQISVVQGDKIVASPISNTNDPANPVSVGYTFESVPLLT